MKAWISSLALLLCIGCGKSPSTSQSATNETSSGGIVDAITQKSKIEAGKSAAETIRKVSAQEKKDREEAYGE